MRWLTLDPDPTAGGTSLDDLEGTLAGTIPVPDPADAVVVTTGNVDPGVRTLNRDDDVRGRRANASPISFAAAPSMTFEGRAWTSILRRLLPRAMGGALAQAGGPDPAAAQTTVQMAQDGNLPALIGTLVREGQIDRVTGLWVDELTVNLPADGEGTIEGNLMGLYHEVDETANVAGLPTIAGAADQADAYMLRDVSAIMGDGAGTPIDCLGGFGFTINNNLSDDFRTRFCAGRNIFEALIDGDLKRLWYPDRNKLGPQTVTGRLDFGDVRPDRELRRILTHAEKLVVELVGPPLGTTPPADEMVRLVFWKQTPTGGGAEPLQREGDQQSSYEFTAYLDDATGKDLEAVLVGTDPFTYA
jgi:Phage tail tube protein